jgi:uridine kinase
MNRSDLLGELATIILGLGLPHPTRVAFDGVDAAGKTTLANEVAAVLKPSARHIIRASVDGFHNPRHIRRRDDSAEGYFRCSFNYPVLIDRLLVPLGPDGSRLFRRAAFDFRTDSAVVSEQERAAPNAILLLDGVFLLRSELRSHWDLSIFVEADFDATVARAEARDHELFGDEAAVRQRYETRYIPGQRIYIERERSRHFADIVVVNNDFNNPRLERAAQPVAQRGRPACGATPPQRPAG